MRLIDADALKHELYNMCQDYDGVQMLIREAPTIDAVPVVRCKDCKHLNIACCGLGTNDFCSYGERKTT